MAKKSFGEIYLRYGVYQERTLFFACGGNFASRAWTESDEAFKQILGEKFDAITGDDGKEWNINKHAIRRLKNQQEFDALLSQSSPAFRLAIEIEEANIPVNKWLTKMAIMNCLSDMIQKLGYEEARKQIFEELK